MPVKVVAELFVEGGGRGRLRRRDLTVALPLYASDSTPATLRPACPWESCETPRGARNFACPAGGS
ncbi:hypothetical protein ACWGLF_34230 [Streptomyces puniciscabiei]